MPSKTQDTPPRVILNRLLKMRNIELAANPIFGCRPYLRCSKRKSTESRRKNIMCFILFGLLHTYLFAYTSSSSGVESHFFPFLSLLLLRRKQRPLLPLGQNLIGMLGDYRETFAAPRPSTKQPNRRRDTLLAAVPEKEYYILLNSA